MRRAQKRLGRNNAENKPKMKSKGKQESNSEGFILKKETETKIEQPKHHIETENTSFTKCDKYDIFISQSNISSNTKDKNVDETKEDIVHVPRHDNHNSKLIFMIHKISIIPNFFIGTDLKVSSFTNPIQCSHINFVIYLVNSQR